MTEELKLNHVYNEDCLITMKRMPDNFINCIVTSPPYFGLRDYGVVPTKWPAVTFTIFGKKHRVSKMTCCLGLEPTPEAYVGHMVLVFREAMRVLRKDGTLWVNIGDSYNNRTTPVKKSFYKEAKPKDLLGIPWMVAYALRSEGWYLRSDIIWYKKVIMPESVKDRPSKCHEHIFLLSKSSNYYYNYEAIMKDAVWDVDGNGTIKRKDRQNEANKAQPTETVNAIRKSYTNGKHAATHQSVKAINGKRNKRDVWEINPTPFPEAHFATFPEELPRLCIFAGCPEGGIVYDLFGGSGTTAAVALRYNRKFIISEISSGYCKINNTRIKVEYNLFNTDQK